MTPDQATSVLLQLQCITYELAAPLGVTAAAVIFGLRKR